LTNPKIFVIIITEREEKKMQKNFWKKETTKDFTAWDLNCRHVVSHKKRHNKLEKIFRRKNRRKIKKALDRWADL
jgi:hypothetical protein